MTPSTDLRAPGRPPSWLDRLFAPMAIQLLVGFRWVVGGTVLWEVVRYLSADWVERFYIDPDYLFKYFGFSWVVPWPGNWMYVHVFVLGVAAVFVVLGLFYRVSALVMAIGITYLFLLDQAQYLNHVYLIVLLSWLLVVVPAAGAASIDGQRHPGSRRTTAPAWSVALVVGQLGLVYLHAGVAKLGADWLAGEPIRSWLATRTDFPLVGRWFTEPWMVALFSYGAIAIDLAAAPLLVWRRSRPWMFAVLVVFHLANARLFSIGVFPWMMIGASALFFWLRDVPGTARVPSPSRRRASWIAAGVGGYLLFQALFPLRHWLYPGHVHWTEEGHRFAWHMKLRDKAAEVRFEVVDEMDGERSAVRLRDYVNRMQARRMAARPDMILQAAHWIADDLSRPDGRRVRVYAVSSVSLNGRPPRPMIDPEVDLAAEGRSLAPARWILPFQPTAESERRLRETSGGRR